MRKNNGSKGRTKEDVYSAFCELQNDFQPLGIQFNLVSVNSINNSDIYTFGNSCGGPPTKATMISKINKVEYVIGRYNNNAINVYVADIDQMHAGYTKSIPGQVIFLGGIEPYACTGDLLLDGVLSHEIGHALGLYHLDRGLCGQLIPGFLLEYADPNRPNPNCGNAGDEVCDTYPDVFVYQNCSTAYDQLGSTIISCGSTWNGQGTPGDPRDAFNDRYIAMPGQKNIMDVKWATSTCGHNLTSGQGDKIKSMFVEYPDMQVVLNNVPAGTPVLGSDLFIKDDLDDEGLEPNIVSGVTVSPDIWIRNQPDGLLNSTSENPDFVNGDPYVYVRVRNRGCETSLIQPLRLYWAKAGTSLSWPSNWDGGTNFPGTNLKMGNQIGVQQIPVLKPGEEFIAEFHWPMNPNDLIGYANLFNEYWNTWHYCLLARMNGVSGTNLISFPETINSGLNVKSNNNIAARNITVVDPGSQKFKDIFLGGTIAVGNISDTGLSNQYSLDFKLKGGDIHSFNKEIVVRVFPDSTLIKNYMIRDKMFSKLIKRGDGFDLPHVPYRLNLEMPDSNIFPGLMVVTFLPVAELYKGTPYSFICQQYSNELSAGDSVVLNFIGEEEFKLSLPESDFNVEVILDSSNAFGNSQLHSTNNDSNAINDWRISDTIAKSGHQLSFEMNGVSESVVLLSLDKTSGVVAMDSLTVNMSLGQIVSISPNPAALTTNLVLDLSSIDLDYTVDIVKSLDGQLMSSVMVDSMNMTLDLAGLEKGYYYVVLRCSSHIIDQKIFQVQ